jgi:hypothetical protein
MSALSRDMKLATQPPLEWARLYLAAIMRATDCRVEIVCRLKASLGYRILGSSFALS